MSDKFDRKGNPISLEERTKLFSNPEYKRVRFDKFDDDLFVSTVWLGLDHSFGGDKPIIFETMIFSSKSDIDIRDGEQRRYSTEEEAIAGHRLVIRMVREILDRHNKK